MTTSATTATATEAWLTRLVLNPAHRQTHRDLGNAAALHQRVMRLVPDGLGDAPRARAGVLFRVEPEGPGGPGAPVVLVQTQVPPDTARLPAGYAAEAQTRSMRPMFEALRPGRAVRYRLLGNAVRRCGPNSTAGKWKQVVPLHGAEADQWWAARSHICGLELITARSEQAAAVSTRHDPTLWINRSATLFEGQALVRDPEALRAALLHGIGRSKNYGCGLLSLAPAAAPASAGT
jgi:CRISPR system Cascade subunit CasE